MADSSARTVSVFALQIVEPFLPHPSHTEFYVCINSVREGDYILFTHEGGVDVGDVDAKAYKLLIPVGKDLPTREIIKDTLLSKVQPEKQEVLVDFLIRMYSTYVGMLLFSLLLRRLARLFPCDRG